VILKSEFLDEKIFVSTRGLETSFGVFPPKMMLLFSELKKQTCPQYYIHKTSQGIEISAMNGEFKYVLRPI
jgi:hypothetical protein